LVSGTGRERDAVEVRAVTLGRLADACPLKRESLFVHETWMSLTNKESSRGYESLSAAERVFWNVYLLDLEVHNGGFLQYFGNTEAQYAGDLLASLTAIGADATMARVERFFSAVFPGGVPKEAGARRDLALRLEADEGRFQPDEEALTEWYWQDTDTIMHRLQAYARERGLLVE
jgi:hypothetical protein